MTAVIAFAAFALCWLTLAPASAATYRFAKPALDAIHPRPRAALLLGLAVLPLAVATLVAVLGFAPLIGGLVVDHHCHPITGCATHVPTVHAGTPYTVTLVLAAIGASGALLWSIARRLQSSLLVARSLRFLAERPRRQPYEVLESREPFAYCIGLVRPHVVLSRGLISRLSRPQLDVVVRHEQAHATRRDNLRSWLAGIALLPCPRRLKQPLLAELALAGEQACDDAAAAVGGRDLVIETLGALGAAPSPSRVRARADFDNAATVASRIAALRSVRHFNPPIFSVVAVVAIAYGAAAIVSTDVIHHGTEWLLAWFG